MSMPSGGGGAGERVCVGAIVMDVGGCVGAVVVAVADAGTELDADATVALVLVEACIGAKSDERGLLLCAGLALCPGKLSPAWIVALGKRVLVVLPLLTEEWLLLKSKSEVERLWMDWVE